MLKTLLELEKVEIGPLRNPPNYDEYSFDSGEASFEIDEDDNRAKLIMCGEYCTVSLDFLDLVDWLDKNKILIEQVKNLTKS